MNTQNIQPNPDNSRATMNELVGVRVERIQEDDNIYFLVETRNGALHFTLFELAELAKGIRRELRK